MKKKARAALVTPARKAGRKAARGVAGKVVGAPPGKSGSRKAAAPRSAAKLVPVRVVPDAAATSRALIRRLKAQLAKAQAEIVELREHADTDVMLEISNRRGFLRELERALAYIKRYRASGALVVLDVDRLKPINDAFGHAAGDAVLKAIAQALLKETRASDVVGRIGGDEFAVLLWNLSATDAKAKAASFESAIDALTFRFEGQGDVVKGDVVKGDVVKAGASAGVAVLSGTGDAARALEEADRAMYVRKAQRRHE